MFCPLLLIALQAVPQAVLSDAACRGDGCAWWYESGTECSVLALVKELHHHLPNIAGAVAKG